MKYALFGPGYGHNIEPFLKYFNERKEAKVDFYYRGGNSFQKKYIHSIRYLPSPKCLLQFMFNIRKYDVIWLMGGGRLLYLISLLLFFKKKRSMAILHIWSEDLPLRATAISMFGKLTTLAMNRFNIITCNWYGTADIIKDKFKNKVQVNVLGLSDSYFRKPSKIDPEINILAEMVDDEAYNFYYPKSIVKASRHDLIVEAVSFLSKEKIPRFKVYFADGNVVDIKRKKEISNSIEEFGISNFVEILPQLKYFDTENFNLMWEKMHCGLQIAEHDQLSNTIFEPLINKKDLIISDILPYRYIKDYFGFELELTPLDSRKIANAMRKKILGEKNIDSDQILRLIKSRYLFCKNFNRFIVKIEKFF